MRDLKSVSFEDNVFQSEVSYNSIGGRILTHEDHRLQPPEDRWLQRTRRHISQSSYTSDGSFRSRTSSYYSETGGSHDLVLSVHIS